MDNASVEKRYSEAREKLAEIGVNTDEALQKLEAYQLSIHCWQGDDLRGFEKSSSELTGSGLQVTGNYPGRPRNVEELRQDLCIAAGGALWY